MTEVIEKVIGLFPEYFRDLVGLVTGPKRFVAQRLQSGRLFERSLIFLAISFAATYVLKIPTVQQDLVSNLASEAAFTLVQAVAFGLAVWVAWRLVGGRGTLAVTLVITFYYAGVIDYIETFGYLGILGILRAADPGLFADLVQAAHNGTILSLMSDVDRLRQSLGFRIVMFVSLPLMLLALLAWIIAGWGAYRAQHHRSAGRSMAALLIFGVLALPAAAVTFVIATALVR